MEQNLWGNRLKAFSWRIDVKTKARHIEQLNQPAAIMELQLSASNKDTSEVGIDFYCVCYTICVWIVKLYERYQSTTNLHIL